MARYTDTLRDQNLRAIPGALVAVTAYDGTAAVLTDDSAQPLDNPFLTDVYGNYTFNTSSGIYTISFTYGGRTILKEVVTAGTLIANLAPDPANAGKFIALDANGVPTYSSGTGADSGLRTDLAAVGGAALAGFSQVGTGAVARTVLAKTRELRTVKDFGATGDRVTDDTAAFQTAFADVVALNVDVPYNIYKITHVDLDLLGRVFDGRGAVLEGAASTSKTSMVGLRGGSSFYANLRVSVNFNQYYKSGVHWYTNRLDIADRYKPGYVDIDTMQIEGALIGLAVGALPDQVSIGAQNTIAADGVAIDAPLAESVVSGFRATNCVVGCYFRQPNGKVTFIGPRMNSETDEWVSRGYSSVLSSSSALVINNDGSEVTILGGTMEHIQGGDNGTLFSVTGGRLVVIGSVIESTVPAYVDGHSYVYLDHILNFGLNYTVRAFMEVGPTFDGTLSISNTRILRPKANVGTGEVAKAVSGIGGSFSPNLKTVMNFTNVEFRDCPWVSSGSSYQPIVRGLRASFVRCQLTAYDNSLNRTKLIRIDDGPDQLAGKVDRTYESVGAYPQTASPTTVGGWTFTVAGGGSQYGKDTSALPTIEDEAVYAWMRLKAGAGGTTNVESAKFTHKPSKANIWRGIIATGTTGATVVIKVKHWQYDGGAASTAETIVFAGQESQFGATPQPLLFYFIPPADADQSSLFIQAENNADVRVMLLEVN